MKQLTLDYSPEILVTWTRHIQITHFHCRTVDELGTCFTATWNIGNYVDKLTTEATNVNDILLFFTHFFSMFSITNIYEGYYVMRQRKKRSLQLSSIESNDLYILNWICLYTSWVQKTVHFTFDYNFGKCRRIYKIPSLSDSCETFVHTCHNDSPPRLKCVSTLPCETWQLQLWHSLLPISVACCM